jgi:hypothetical protein
MRIALVLMIGALAFGCDDADTDTDTPDNVSIIGEWVDSFATEHDISAESWVQRANDPMTMMVATSTYAIVSIDADSMVIIAENDANNAFFPGKFSRFDWVQDGDQLYFCQSAFDAETADAAANVDPPDPSDPANGGCGGMFPWSALLTR